MTRPCKYCVAGWSGISAQDCVLSHRDDERVYALARAMAVVMQQRKPSDEQISWFLQDADGVVDDFDPAPERWRVRRLPESAGDHEWGIEIRIRINDVTYVGLEGGKDVQGQFVKLSTFRSWHKPEPSEVKP